MDDVAKPVIAGLTVIGYTVVAVLALQTVPDSQVVMQALLFAAGGVGLFAFMYSQV